MKLPTEQKKITSLKITKPVEFDFATESLGTLGCSYLTWVDTLELNEEINTSKQSPRLFVESILQRIVTKINNKDISERGLSETETASLSDKEIEEFSKLYLENNLDWLLDRDLDASGDHREDPDDKAIEKCEDETESHYLLRLFKKRAKETIDKWEDRGKRFADLVNQAGVTSATAENMLTNFDLSRQLSERLNQITKNISRHIPPSIKQLKIKPEYNNLKIEPAFVREEAPSYSPTLSLEALGPFEPPGHKTNELINTMIEQNEVLQKLMVDSTRLTSSMNDTLVGMLAEMSGGSQRNEANSRISIRMTGIAIFVAALTLLASIAIPVWITYQSGKESKAFETSMLNLLSDIKAAEVDNNDAVIELFDKLNGAYASDREVSIELINHISRIISESDKRVERQNEALMDILQNLKEKSKSDT